MTGAKATTAGRWVGCRWVAAAGWLPLAGCRWVAAAGCTKAATAYDSVDVVDGAEFGSDLDSSYGSKKTFLAPSIYSDITT
ncbi:MAG TPA: hypothetical protein V6C72_13360 [Chroococcales cyanobacterium]